MTTPELTVRLFAAAAAAGGARELVVHADTLGQLRDALGHDRPALAGLLGRCSFLVDGLIARDVDLPLLTGSTVDVLPPFAGG